MRFVLDTNLLVSGVTAAGLPRRLVDGTKAGEFAVVANDPDDDHVLSAALFGNANLIASGDPCWGRWPSERCASR